MNKGLWESPHYLSAGVGPVGTAAPATVCMGTGSAAG